MAMYVTDKKIFIFVADSDAIDNNRIKDSTNSKSTTTNYCPPESIEQNDKFYIVLGERDNLCNKPIYLDVTKLKEYKKTIITRIKNKYSSIFKGNMNDFEDNCDKLISLGKDVMISKNLYLTGERPYLDFNDEPNWKLFKSVLYGEASIIVIESKQDRFIAYPMFRPLFSKPEDVKWDNNTSKLKFISQEYNLTEDELANKLKEMYNSGEKVLNIHLFGIKYGEYIRKMGFNVSEIVSKAGISSTYFVEVNKGIKLSSFVCVKTDESICTSIDSENYIKFKNVVYWFVNQLNINNNIIEGEKHFGQGYNDGSSIRKYYEKWRDYGSFTLDCNFIAGYQSAYPKSNYINVTGTGIDIRPRFDENTKKVTGISIALDEKVYQKNIIYYNELLNKEYLIEELDLSNENASEKLKDLFDNYKKIIDDLTNKKDYIGAYNKIYYGAPGCGKSYYVKHTLIPSIGIIDDENHVVRTTFYQDYLNTDFVGQILPKIENGDVTYEFTPGPFAIALKNALKHRDESTILIIEEINRGNAASIFGDIFQLLDRKKDGSSEYEINHTNLQQYIKNELGLDLPKICIPSNLYIIGTMNTSDQNVFTLDTAFKRRWKFEKVKNEFDGNAHDNWFVPGTDGTTWRDLVVAINNYIVSNADEFTNEDKQIGVYFIDENGLVEDKLDVNNPDKVKEFAYKMLEYLWDDVAKFTDKQKWFDNNIKTLDQLIENYEEKAKENKALEVFGKDLNELINKKSN